MRATGLVEYLFFFFNDTATTEIYTLSLHDALPIYKQQEAMMDLYRKRRVNPLGGFLPVLVQLPVFVTMYQVVRGHEESFPSFANGGLLWFVDLTGPDPYFVLPVLSASLLIAAGEVSARN